MTQQPDVPEKREHKYVVTLTVEKRYGDSDSTDSRDLGRKWLKAALDKGYDADQRTDPELNVVAFLIGGPAVP